MLRISREETRRTVQEAERRRAAELENRAKEEKVSIRTTTLSLQRTEVQRIHQRCMRMQNSWRLE